MSQAYSRQPSNIYEVKGAVGLFFDRAIFLFGREVESEIEKAGQDALSPGFARSAQQRAFARCMGDDMATSTVGFADPAADGKAVIREEGSGEEIIASGY
jgi:hypothetical protein